MIQSNLHTHTKYCDGKNTPEEIVKHAISLGFSAVGFSGHGLTPCDLSYCMTEENTEKYIKEINFLKEKYKGKIEIYLGLEADLYSCFDKNKFDYIIGSCHYVNECNERFSVDTSEETQKNIVKTYFDGDYLKFARSYYENVAKLPSISPDIIGHFDLVTKYNEGNKYFDENDKKYLDLAFCALDSVLCHCDLFEVNTGAIARGYKTTPYPAIPILKRLKEKGARVIITSDCHDAKNIDCNFEKTRKLLKEIGFSSATILKCGEFLETPL